MTPSQISQSEASPRKAKKPTTSVTMVTNTPEATAGSKPARVSVKRDEDAGQRRRQQIEDHGRGDHQPQLADAEPEAARPSP